MIADAGTFFFDTVVNIYEKLHEYNIKICIYFLMKILHLYLYLRHGIFFNIIVTNILRLIRTLGYIIPCAISIQ